jgi:hypothetical protein
MKNRKNSKKQNEIIENSPVVDEVLAEVVDEIVQEEIPTIVENYEAVTETIPEVVKVEEIVEVTPVVVEPVQEVAEVVPTVVKAETPKVVMTPKEPKIIVSQLVLLEGTEIVEKKSYNRLNRNGMSIIIKSSSTLEFNTVVENLDPRQKVLTEQERKISHLGNTKMILKGVKDTADFQEIMNKYFSAK